MRRALILTVLATSSMVLLAMLVPLALLIRNYDLEDRLARAALGVQATETVVSRHDRGMVSAYLERLNAEDAGIQTTVLYPDGIGVGPHPGEDEAVATARVTGQARVDDTATGARILSPVSLGGSSGSPEQTPVVRVDVGDAPFPSAVHVAWLVLALLGLLILAGALVLADRIGQSFVRPVRRLARDAERLGGPEGLRTVEVEGPAEVRQLADSLNRLSERIENLLEREREQIADLSHRLRTPITTLRLDVESLQDPGDRDRLTADIDRLHHVVDHVIDRARRRHDDTEVVSTDAVTVLVERTEYWRPLAEEQARPFALTVEGPGRPRVPVSPDDLVSLVDVLLDNVFSHTPPGTEVTVLVTSDDDAALSFAVSDDGPGFTDGTDAVLRGTSGAGSTGLGLSIAADIARAAGGDLRWGSSARGGAEVVVTLSGS